MKIRSRKKRRYLETSFPEITLTPLIDTAFVLLVIFMVTSPMMQKKNQETAGIKVELPKGNAQETEGLIEDIIITINALGKIFLNGKQMSEKELITHIKKLTVQHNERTVFVRADEKVAYGKIIEIIDKIKFIGGVKYVALATIQS